MRQTIQANAFWIAEPGRGEIRSEHLPALPNGWVRIRTLYSGISRGTEALVFRGEVPRSEYARMRAPFQAGDFPGPVKYGYISTGIVEDGPSELLGLRVYCLFPHQDIYQVPADQVHPLPDEVPSRRAVLAANLETAINGLWDAAPRIGDRISVVGAGTLGCLVAWLCAGLPGCSVELIDCNPRRAAIAQRLGAAFRLPEHASGEQDVVFHASGSAQGLSTALRLAGFEATVVEMSWFGTRAVPLALGEDFHQRRLTLRSSQVGHVATSQRARWDHRRRMSLALSLLADETTEILITGEDAFERLPLIQKHLAAEPGDTLMHRIRYR
ncbi:MAG: zinc-binding alcohol dehydrogenase [Thiohalocapsa sp.]|nr:zinc-binding alcohol dehydrogenase [Thiohalocapsa sp.]MCF7992491.1 zinc-binding alcohol dehydrogenase [Thiohalocapsa sp.]